MKSATRICQVHTLTNRGGPSSNFPVRFGFLFSFSNRLSQMFTLLIRLQRLPIDSLPNTSSSPGLHTFLHNFGADMRFDLHPLLSAPANIAAIRLLADNSLEAQFLDRDK